MRETATPRGTLAGSRSAGAVLAGPTSLLLALVVAGLSLAGCGAAPANPSSNEPHVTAAPPSAPPPLRVSASPSRTAAAARPPSSAAAQSAPGAGIVPSELLIPAIHVDAPVEHVGTTPDGAMDVPKQWNDVAWFDQGYKPGQPGSAVIAGHLDSTTDRAVFWDLNKLKPGDSVLVKGTDSAKLTFQVTESEVYSFDQAPLKRIFGASAQPELTLVTCSGAFDRGTKNYDKRLVVYARLAG